MTRPDPRDYPAEAMPSFGTIEAKVDALLLLCDRIRVATTAPGLGPEIDRLDQRVDDLKGRLERRLAGAEARLTEHRRMIDNLEAKLLALGELVDGIVRRLADDGAMKERLDAYSQRLAAVEQSAFASRDYITRLERGAEASLRKHVGGES